MKILTWNINGIRSSKIQLKQLLDELDADIICLQETKVTRDQLDEPTAIVDGYNSYFSFSKAKSGYSGVATFCKDIYSPIKAEEGLSDLLRGNDTSSTVGNYGDHTGFSDEELHALDNEGRTVITQHKFRTPNNDKEELLTVINVYCPRADPDRVERKLYKMQFYQLLQSRAETLIKAGSHVIILGDVNTSHRRIDHCDPDDDIEFKKNPGRQWLDTFLWEESSQGPGKFVDSFRYINPNQTNAFTCWNTSSGARATNYGTRIDYIFADVEFIKKCLLTDCSLHPDVEGSDHCPVKAELDIDMIPAAKCPLLCTKYMPEFAGKQQKLLGYFSAKVNPIRSGDTGHSEAPKAKLNSVQLVPKTSTQPSLVTASKRTGATATSQVSKKPKLDSKTNSRTKQCSLVNFFSSATSAKKPDINRCKSEPLLSGTNSSSQKTANSGEQLLNSFERDSSDNTQTLKSDAQNFNNRGNKTQTEMWKNVFKGPPPAPLCKGHNEPCVLRTVKKDSLNKGRQFWVCNRPEGHKTNPEARCDHFVWITKPKSK